MSMTLPLRRLLKRSAAGMMLALALVYLLHAAWHGGLGEIAPPPEGQAIVVTFDPFVYAESQTGDGVAGCHFFCNHGCPVPPLPEAPVVPAALSSRTFTPRLPAVPRGRTAQPETAPPRLLA